jgi:hypothetical protein
LVSSFPSEKLDSYAKAVDHFRMAGFRKTSSKSRTAGLVRQRIDRGGDRLWRFEDFRDLPFAAVAQSLSRLTRKGVIERLSKGTYYRTRQTAFGKSRPNPAAMQKLAGRRKPVYPAGIAAANLLGFTTQIARRPEVATSGSSLPRKLIGDNALIHTRRPEAWAALPEADAALLDFLRQRGRSGELSPEETVRRTLLLLSQGGRFDRLMRIARFEPPRVRAMLGAIGQQLKRPPRELDRLRRSLNSLTRFDFGALSGLPYARDWFAKEPR